MKTANDFAQAAIQIGQMADKMTPGTEKPQTEPYLNARLLAVFHLRSAASLARRIAEDIPNEDIPNKR